ncbi:MAG TPA: hypothetical protein VJW51_00335 [Candidatus Acidoferrales bacterium]|nr:hypothetical protein [Candidatus Acidoferrales bacterium]
MRFENCLWSFARRPRALKRIQRAARAKGLDLLPLRKINLEIRRYRKETRHCLGRDFPLP